MSNITHELEPRFKTDLYDAIREHKDIDWYSVALLLNYLYIYEPK